MARRAAVCLASAAARPLSATRDAAEDQGAACQVGFSQRQTTGPAALRIVSSSVSAVRAPAQYRTTPGRPSRSRGPVSASPGRPAWACPYRRFFSMAMAACSAKRRRQPHGLGKAVARRDPGATPSNVSLTINGPIQEWAQPMAHRFIGLFYRPGSRIVTPQIGKDQVPGGPPRSPPPGWWDVQVDHCSRGVGPCTPRSKRSSMMAMPRRCNRRPL
jgi:hypothetical protein